MNDGEIMSGRVGELLLILMIVFVIFGAGKLPKVMGELGRGMRALREGLNTTKQKEEDKNL
jgi:sec-independent protein translocase protein TatA